MQLTRSPWWFRTLKLAMLGMVLAARPAGADTPCDFVTSESCSCAIIAATPNPPARFCPPPTAPCTIQLPRSFPCPRLPDDNPLTVEKIELGRFLFYDTRMSGEGLAGRPGQSCASCHQQDKAFTDGRARSIGSTGELHPRSAMSLANVVYASTLTWANPTEVRLEHQALTPMFGEEPVELGLSGKEDQLLDYLRGEPRYQRMFAEAYPDEADPISLSGITRALASFQRTLISGNAPRDRFEQSDAAVRGEFLFFDEKHECFHCHSGFNFQDSVDAEGRPATTVFFHNNGLYNLRCSDFGLPTLDFPWCSPPPSPTLCARQDSSRPNGCNCEGEGPQDLGCFPPDNTGVYAITGKGEDMGKFKAPTLRNIAVTGPYMHDGSVASLNQVLNHYAAGGRTITEGEYAGVGRESPALGSFVRGFDLTPAERADLLAFLESLTDEEFLTNPKFADPFLPVACPGDCNLNGGVEVNELVLGVGVSLETSSLARCVAGDLDGDGGVGVGELVRAVRTALDGCS